MSLCGQHTNRIKICGYEKNCGLGYALKQGMEQCDYGYVARMDSDDISRKDRFEIQMDYLEKHPDIDILGGYLQECDETMENKLSIKKVPLSEKEIYNKIGKANPFNHSTVIVKKDAVKRAGGYKQQALEDYHLWIRMCLKKCKMTNLPVILVEFRTSKEMYQRRSGIKYLCGIKEIEDFLLKSDLINHFQYIINIVARTILAIIPSGIKKYIYPKIIRKY